MEGRHRIISMVEGCRLKTSMSVGVLGTPIGFNLTPSCIVPIDFYTLAIFNLPRAHA
jgi:hypothetical protein